MDTREWMEIIQDIIKDKTNVKDQIEAVYDFIEQASNWQIPVYRLHLINHLQITNLQPYIITLIQRNRASTWV